jgi:hypothetical protein
VAAVKPFRRRPVPDAVRALALPPGERRLGWALTRDGDPVVATAASLLLPGRDPLPWSAVERAGWQRPVMTVVEVAPGAAPVSGTGRTTVLHLDDDAEAGLVDAVHAGVTSSVAWSTHVRFRPAGGARVVGRRRAGEDVLDWQVVYDAGTDVHDPQVRAQAQAVVERSRRSIG